MGLVEALPPLVGVEHHGESRDVVDQVFLAGSVHRVILDVTVVPQQVLVVCPEDPRQDIVQLLLCHRT